MNRRDTRKVHLVNGKTVICRQTLAKNKNGLLNWENNPQLYKIIFLKKWLIVENTENGVSFVVILNCSWEGWGKHTPRPP